MFFFVIRKRLAVYATTTQKYDIIFFYAIILSAKDYVSEEIIQTIIA